MTEQLQSKVDFAINLIQKASKIAAENGCYVELYENYIKYCLEHLI